MQNYVKIPYPIKQGLKYIYSCIPIGYRYSKVFWDTYYFLQKSQWWSREQLEEYQIQELKRLLKYSYEHVPYYRRVFDERYLKPEDIRSKQDINELPILTKEIIRDNFNDLLAVNVDKSDLYLEKTSGTTVSPLTLYWQKSKTIHKEESFIWTIWNIAGYRFNEKRLDLTHLKLNNKLCEYDPLKRVMHISANSMNEDNLHIYVNLIREFQPKVFKSIPSNLIILANYVLRKEIPIFPSIKLVICGSEMLYPWQKKRIEDALQCRLFSFYGQTERVIIGTECEINSQYHIFPEYGITEIIDSDGLPIKLEGTLGKIVGTGFNNYAMPLIRYQVGDIASWCNEKCPCGRNYPLLQSIEGRENEYLVTNTGDLIPIIIIPYSSIMKNVKQFQFYQDTKGKAILYIIPSPSFTQDNAMSIINNLKKELRNIEVKLEYTDTIHRTKGGKYKYIIQKLPIKFGDISI
ncbi:MAG: phenylacetate--CoA ligase family protein [Spirochaetota bacterium]|nr:phenylacetate--CoA ligase family protein [Spirochaetota bacterium]